MDGRFVAYYRVSTDRQGKSGLALEAQRQSVETYLNGGSWTLLREFKETESGKTADRPMLAAAITECRLMGAKLVIAKLDRLSRDAHFLIGLQKAGVDFVAADMPEANKLTVSIMALVAQQEREAISRRTKEALAVAKARRREAGLPPLGGWRGGPKVDGVAGRKARQERAAAFLADVRPIVVQLHVEGQSLRQIAASLSERGVSTRRGGPWTAAGVKRVLDHSE
jgi:DNA invertase Pin-like site-specific DNA recombinase